MTDERTGLDLGLLTELKEPQVYIYILQNSVGKVKVGITKNPVQRVNSLCGSNGQGNAIIKAYFSSPTYLRTIEGIMHNRMRDYRIKGTEWFYYDDDPTGDILFVSAIELIEKLFGSEEYGKCNELRKRITQSESLRAKKLGL